VSNSEEEENDEDGGDIQTMKENHWKEEEFFHPQGDEASLHHDSGIYKVTIDSMSVVPNFNTFNMKGVVQG
jgi:hypothetical protein